MLRWTLTLKGVPKKNFHAAVTVGHKVYSFGGYCVYSDQMSVHVFNTVSLRWIMVPQVTPGRGKHPLEVPSMLYNHTAVPIEDIIYIWGGFTNTGKYCDGLYAFDVDTHVWFQPRVYGTPPAARYNHSACVLRKVMYIYGGHTQLTGRTNAVHKLDTSAMTWSLIDTTKGTPAPASERHFSTVIGTKMVVFGGYGNNYERHNNIRVFDTETDCWLIMSSQLFPDERGDTHAFAYDGELYVFGGRNLDFNDLWKFNPETFSWKKIEPKGKGPSGMSRICCCTVGDHIIIFGVYQPDDLYILDLSPSLKMLCKLAVIQYSLEQSGLPHTIRWELAAMTTNSNRKEY